jgi:hypothetical protein
MSNTPAPEPRYDSLWELLTQRLYWFFIGPMFLILMLLGVLNDEQGRIVLFNGAYLIGLAGLPLSRWLEMRTGRAQTADGRPATWADFRSYSLTVLGVGLAALAAANLWVRFAR